MELFNSRLGVPSRWWFLFLLRSKPKVPRRHHNYGPSTCDLGFLTHVWLISNPSVLQHSVCGILASPGIQQISLPPQRVYETQTKLVQVLVSPAFSASYMLAVSYFHSEANAQIGKRWLNDVMLPAGLVIAMSVTFARFGLMMCRHDFPSAR